MSGFKKSMRAFRRLGLAEELYEDDLKWLEKADGGEYLGEDLARSFKFRDPFSGLPFSLWINMKPVYDTEEGCYLVTGVIYDLDKGRVSEALPFGGENIKRNDDDGIVVCRRHVRAFQPSVLERVSKALLEDLMEMCGARERLAGLGMVVSGIAPFMKVPRGDGFDRLLLARAPFKWELHWLADGWPEKNPPPSPFDGDPGSPFPLNERVFFETKYGSKKDETPFGFFMDSVAGFDYRDFKAFHENFPNHVFEGVSARPGKAEFMAALPEKMRMALVER